MGSLIFRLGQRSFPIGLNSLKLLLVLHEKTSSEALIDWNLTISFDSRAKNTIFGFLPISSLNFHILIGHGESLSLSLSLSLLLEKSNLQTQCTHTHNFGKLIYISLLQSKQPPPTPPLLRQGAWRGGCRPPSCILCACVTHIHTHTHTALKFLWQSVLSEPRVNSYFLHPSSPSFFFPRPLSPLYPFLFPSLLSPPFCFPNIKLSLSRLSSL